MILLGTVARTETINKGDFQCPHCDSSRKYEHKRIANYFSVLNISLYQNGVLADFVECQTCKRQFAPDGLNLAEIELVLPHQVRTA